MGKTIYSESGFHHTLFVLSKYLMSTHQGHGTLLEMNKECIIEEGNRNVQVQINK